MNDLKTNYMKPRMKTILFLILTVYIIPGIAVWLVDRRMLLYYFLLISSTTIPYYFWAVGKKRSCKFFGIEFKF